MQRWIYLLPLSALACAADGGPVELSELDAGGPDAAPPPVTAPTPVARCATFNPDKNVYFGDLHVHTSYSIDSYSFGNRNDPTAAYQFARGATLPIASGSGGATTATLDRPLDFAAVTDHSEFLSLIGTCELGAPGATGECAAFHDQGSQAQATLVGTYLGRLLLRNPLPLPGCALGNAADCATAERTAWAAERSAAATANAPCTFTSLIGYEWTASTGANNLHRNVIFRSDVVPDQPYDYLQHPTAKSLWQALASGCLLASGCDAITIPHNSNYSNGQMWTNADDDQVTRDLMARYQTLVEVYQHKAASECLPGSPLADPACNFETLDGQTASDAAGYARDGLAKGLALRAQHGANPLMMGFISSTDTHNGTAGAVAEDRWQGHGGDQDNSPEGRLDGPTFSPGGLAAVWAPENTRAEIFAALKRRETYATSGPRMAVRTYALAGVPSDAAARAYCNDPAFPRALIAAGAVPMGGQIAAGASPYLFVAAVADRTPLASFDLVRLRLDASGAPTASVRTELLAPAGTGSFCRFWKDPDFQPGVPAVYYARVFEKPTARWSSYDCQLAPTAPACTDGSVPTTIRERAWTSPIFVTP